MTHRRAIAGALILNIPALAGWGIEQQRSREAESTVPAERPSYAEAA